MINSAYTSTRKVLPLQHKPIKDNVLVEPMYDADNVYGIVMPDAYKDSVSHQGYVVANGPTSPFRYPAHVVYQSYRNKFHEQLWINDREYLAIPGSHIAGWIEDGQLMPRAYHVLVRPDEDTTFERKTPAGIILLDPTIYYKAEPIWRGRIIRVGSKCTELRPDDHVVIPPRIGVEVGFIDYNYYLIPEHEVLAKLE